MKADKYLKENNYKLVGLDFKEDLVIFHKDDVEKDITHFEVMEEFAKDEYNKGYNKGYRDGLKNPGGSITKT